MTACGRVQTRKTAPMYTSSTYSCPKWGKRPWIVFILSLQVKETHVNSLKPGRGLLSEDIGGSFVNRRQNTMRLVFCCCITNHPPTSWLPTTLIYCSRICNRDGAQWGSPICGSCGVSWLGFLGTGAPAFRMAHSYGRQVDVTTWWLSSGPYLSPRSVSHGRVSGFH